LSTLREDLEDLVNRWAVGGNGIDAASQDLISACSAELLRVLNEHPDAADDEYRLTDAGKARADAEALRYALVEQMGHRATVATIRETTFCGKQMIEATDLKGGGTSLISPESVYEITWLTEADALARTRPWTAVAIAAAQDDDDDDQVAENGGVWGFTEADL